MSDEPTFLYRDVGPFRGKIVVLSLVPKWAPIQDVVGTSLNNGYSFGRPGLVYGVCVSVDIVDFKKVLWFGVVVFIQNDRMVH